MDSIPTVVRTGYSCPNCLRPAGDYDPECTKCGTNFLSEEPRSPFVLKNSVNKNDKTIFFYVSPLKLYIMSVATFGLYTFFWFYKNWAYVSEHTNKSRWVMPYAFFWTVTYYALMNQIARAGERLGEERFAFPPVVIAIGTFGAAIASAAFPGICHALAPLFLIPTQIYINNLNRHCPSAEINSKFSPANILAIVVGGLAYLAPLIISIIFH